MKHSKHPISARIEDDIYRRLEIVSMVDRRSMADVMAECVRRALPALEQELQQPRLTPAMRARLQAGESVAQVLMDRLTPYSIKPQASILQESPPKRSK